MKFKEINWGLVCVLALIIGAIVVGVQFVTHTEEVSFINDKGATVTNHVTKFGTGMPPKAPKAKTEG